MCSATAPGRRAASSLGAALPWTLVLALALTACEFRAARSEGGGAFEVQAGAGGSSDAYAAHYLTRHGATCFVVAGARFKNRRWDASPPAQGSMTTPGGLWFGWKCEPEKRVATFTTLQPQVAGGPGGSGGTCQTFDLSNGGLFLAVERDGVVHVEQRAADLTKLAPTSISLAFHHLAVVDPRVATFFDACAPAR